MIETGFEVARPLGGTPILIDQKILDEIAETVARAAGIFQCNSPNPDGTCPEAFLIKDTNGDPVPDISGFDTSYTELVLPPCPADFSYDLCDDWSLATPAGIGTSGNNLLLYSEHAVTASDGDVSISGEQHVLGMTSRAPTGGAKRRVRRCRPRRWSPHSLLTGADMASYSLEIADGSWLLGDVPYLHRFQLRQLRALRARF